MSRYARPSDESANRREAEAARSEGRRAEGIHKTMQIDETRSVSKSSKRRRGRGSANETDCFVFVMTVGMFAGVQPSSFDLKAGTGEVGREYESGASVTVNTKLSLPACRKGKVGYTASRVNRLDCGVRGV